MFAYNPDPIVRKDGRNNIKIILHRIISVVYCFDLCLKIIAFKAMMMSYMWGPERERVFKLLPKYIDDRLKCFNTSQYGLYIDWVVSFICCLQASASL